MAGFGHGFAVFGSSFPHAEFHAVGSLVYDLRTDHEVVALEFIEHSGQKRAFALAFARLGCQRRPPHAPGGEADNQEQSSQRKPDARLLVFRLRKRFLVGLGIGHRDRGTIDDLDRVPLPVPRFGVGLDAVGDEPPERGDDHFGQALPRLAIAARERREMGVTSGRVVGRRAA